MLDILGVALVLEGMKGNVRIVFRRGPTSGLRYFFVSPTIHINR